MGEGNDFRAAVHTWADRLNVDFRSISLRTMRTKWASCSNAGNLTFSDEVPSLDGELQTYIIVHELLHFSVPNHGKLWKSLMRAYLGEYEVLEERLRRIESERRRGPVGADTALDNV